MKCKTLYERLTEESTISVLVKLVKIGVVEYKVLRNIEIYEYYHALPKQDRFKKIEELFSLKKRQVQKIIKKLNQTTC